MKETFDIPNADLLRLSITLKEHKPYMVLAVNSTGVNNTDFMGNQPIRVYIQEFVYSEDRQEYIKGMTFDKKIKCSSEALEYALKNESNFDVFANSGIDKEAYLNGIDVLEVSDFKTAFEAFLGGAEDNTLFIANGMSFCKTMLQSIDCDDKFSELITNKQVLDQRALTVAYFRQHTISPKKTTLEALNDVVHNLAEGQTQKIIGVANRVRVISDFVDRYGVEEGYLIPDSENGARMATTYLQDIQNSGRKKYLNADLDAKFSMLIGNPKQALSAEVIDREHDCDLNRLYDIIEGKTDAKGIVFFQVGTTGFKADNMPLQFSAVLCQLRDGHLVATKQQYFDIRTEQRAIQKALDLKNKGEFDAFAYTGIDIDAYFEGYQTDPSGVKSAKPQKDKESAVNTINRFFEKYPPSEYPLITNGRGRDGQSFSQTALASLANISIINAPYIDFTQVIKEYSYVAHYSSEYPSNVLFDEARGIKNFSLAEVGQHQAAMKGKQVEEVYIENCHSLRKCRFVVDMINQICKQHNEMLYGTPEQTEIQQPAPEHNNTVPESPVSVTPKSKNRSDSAQSELLEKSLIDNIRSIIEGNSSEAATSSNEDNGIPSTSADEANFISEGYGNILDSTNASESVSAPSVDDTERLIAERKAEADILRENVQGDYIERTISKNSPSEQAPIRSYATEGNNGETATLPNDKGLEKTPEPKETVQIPQAPVSTANEAPTSPTGKSGVVEATTEPTPPVQNSIPENSQQQIYGVTPDIAALVSAMTAQTIAYQSQMNIMNTQLSALMEQNNALISFMSNQNKALFLTLESAIEALSVKNEVEHSNERSSEKSLVERLEEVKDTIASFFPEVPATSKAFLQNANSMISKGQTEIDKSAQRDKPSKPD